MIIPKKGIVVNHCKRHQKEAWTFKGRIHFIAGKKGKVPLTVTFPSFPNIDLCDALKALGFSWNIHEYRWEGHGDAEEIKNLLKPYGGKIQE